MNAREKLNEFAELRGWDKNKLIGWSEAADFGEWLVKNRTIPCVSGSFSFDDMANFAIWIKDNFSDEIAGAFARRSDGNLYWDEQVGELVKIWHENYH